MKKYLLPILVLPFIIFFLNTPTNAFEPPIFLPACERPTGVCEVGEVYKYSYQFRYLDHGFYGKNGVWLPIPFKTSESCINIISPLWLVNTIAILLLTILLKLPIYLLQFKKYTKSLKPLIYSNLIIVPLFLILYTQILNIVKHIIFDGRESYNCVYPLPDSLQISKIVIPAIILLAVIVTETLLLKKWVKEVPRRILYFYTFLANLLLAILGGIIHSYFF